MGHRTIAGKLLLLLLILPTKKSASATFLDEDEKSLIIYDFERKIGDFDRRERNKQIKFLIG